MTANFDDPRFVRFDGNLRVREIVFDLTDPTNRTVERPLPTIPDAPGQLLTKLNGLFGSREARERACRGIYDGINNKMVEKLGLSIRVAPDEGDVCNLSDTGELHAYYEEQLAAGGGSLVLKYITRNNSVKWHQTTPGVLGSFADPQFAVTFDTELLLNIFFPFELSARIVATSAVAREQKAHVRAENFAGDIVSFIDDVIRAFGGEGIFGPAEKELNSKTDDITSGLSGAFDNENNELSNAFRFGFTRMLTRIDPNDTMRRPDQSVATGSLIIALVKGVNEIPAGDGRISGRVRWAKTNGAPREGSPCAGLRFSVEAQSGFKVGLDLFPPLTKVGVVGGLSHNETADFHECSYSIVGLPIDVPLTLSVTGNPLVWADPVGRVFDVIAGKPDNFANPITLSHPLTVPPPQEQPISIRRLLQPGDGTLANVLYLLDRFQRL